MKIRPEQMEALRIVPMVGLKEAMCRELVENWGPLTDQLGPESTGFFVDQAVERSSFYGIDLRRDHFRYLNVMALLGADFDEEFDWAREILESRALRGTARMDRLVETIRLKAAGGDL